MKFESSLIFNSQPEWQDYYINYQGLKTAVYKSEKEALQTRLSNGPGADEERGGLLANQEGSSSDPDGQGSSSSSSLAMDALSDRFRGLCDVELKKIESFYHSKEQELLGQLQDIKEEIEQIEEEGQFGTIDDDSDEGSDESGDEGDQGLLKRGGKLLKNVIVGGSNARNKSGERYYDEEADRPRHRRMSSSNGRRPRSSTESNGSASSTDNSNLAKVSSRDGLPQETLVEIENQVERTMDAAEASPQPQQSPLQNNAPLQRVISPAVPTSSRRRRASSFAGGYASTAQESSYDVWSSNSKHAIDMRITFKLRLQAIFRDLSQLQEYVQLNQTGFRKILKKFDKVTSSSLQKAYMEKVVRRAYPFKEETQNHLNEAIQSVIPLYSKVATRGDTNEALRQLKIQLREHVVWERNTIWREMIGLERKGWIGGGGRRRAGDGETSTSNKGAMDKPILVQKELSTGDGGHYMSTPCGRFRIPGWVSKETIGGTVALVAFIAILCSNLFDRVEERNCLAILVFASIFWAMEVVPLFATSLLVPFLIVGLRVLRSTDGQDTRLPAVEASKYIFSQMFTGTIVLLVGGFTLAGALSKQNIDKILASRVLAFAGTKPSTVLVAYMGVACFSSMWISNVAAPVLCFSLIQPILRTLPNKSTYGKALVLGIALASNLGGMASPIASPQNLIAISYMSEPLSWAQWFVIALPVAGVSIVCIWLLLVWLYGWEKGTTINPVRPTKEKFTATQWFVCFVTLATVGLLCVEHQLEAYVGDMGIIALIPIVIFFGSGILRKQDFDNFPWSIVFLAMGGIALGKGVLSSGLLASLNEVIERAIQGLDVWPILAIFSFMSLIVATFVSHSIASVLLAPIAAQIGAALDPPHSTLLIMATALICSAGMGLPVSGFPNLMAVNLEDDVGNRYLTVNDFLKAGIPASVLAMAVIITLGYLMMRLIGL